MPRHIRLRRCGRNVITMTEKKKGVIAVAAAVVGLWLLWGVAAVGIATTPEYTGGIDGARVAVAAEKAQTHRALHAPYDKGAKGSIPSTVNGGPEGGKDAPAEEDAVTGSDEERSDGRASGNGAPAVGAGGGSTSGGSGGAGGSSGGNANTGNTGGGGDTHKPPADPNAGKVWHEPEYKTVHHPAEYETVVHDEVVEWVWYFHFHYDGYETTSVADKNAHGKQLGMAELDSSWTEVQRPVVVQEAWTEQVLVREAWDEQVLVREGYWG
jgi:hypothetical protein